MNDIASKFSTAARILLGIGFLIPGLNGFFHFLPTPPMPESARDFVGALLATGYLLPLLKGLEVAAAVMLLAGRFVPLALAILAPVLVNIVAFHLALAPLGLAMPLVLAALELYLAWSYRDAFRPMLRKTPALPKRDATTAESHLAVA